MKIGFIDSVRKLNFEYTANSRHCRLYIPVYTRREIHIQAKVARNTYIQKVKSHRK